MWFSPVRDNGMPHCISLLASCLRQYISSGTNAWANEALSRHSLLGPPLISAPSIIPNTNCLRILLLFFAQLCPEKLSFLPSTCCTVFHIQHTRLCTTALVIYCCHLLAKTPQLLIIMGLAICRCLFTATPMFQWLLAAVNLPVPMTFTPIVFTILLRVSFELSLS